VHGVDATEKVIAASKALFGGGDLAGLDAATLGAAVQELPTVDVRVGDPLVDVLAGSGLVASKGAARRAIAEGGASVNNTKVTDEAQVLTAEDLLHGRWAVLRRGKRTLAVARLVEG
jgi:tyrosyl-tRNA synthetase